MNDDFYTSLQKKLDAQNDWPSLYMFKFIIPADNEKIARTEALFGPAAEISTHQSKTGKFISITAKVVMISSNEIIALYKKAADIEGIIAL
jgi:hypothetical protein